MHFPSTSSPPTPTAQAPAFRKSPTVSRFTPPVGIISIWGKGPLSALMYLAPPTLPHGKILTASAPASQAVRTSVGVRAPGHTTLEYRLAISMVAGFRLGQTRNSAPASMQIRAV